MGIVTFALGGSLLGLNFVSADVWREFGWPFFQRMTVPCICLFLMHCASGGNWRMWKEATSGQAKWIILSALTGAFALVLVFIAVFLGQAPVSVALHMSSSVVFFSVLGRSSKFHCERTVEIVIITLSAFLLAGYSVNLQAFFAASASGLGACSCFACAEQIQGPSRLDIAGCVGGLAVVLLVILPSTEVLDKSIMVTGRDVDLKWEVSNAVLMLLCLAAVAQGSKDINYTAGLAFAIPLTVFSCVAQVLRRGTVTVLYSDVEQGDVVGVMLMIGGVALGFLNELFETDDGCVTTVLTQQATPVTPVPNVPTMPLVAPEKKKKEESRWTCPGCDEINAASRSECNSCRQERPEPPRLPPKITPSKRKEPSQSSVAPSSPVDAARQCKAFERGYCKDAEKCKFEHTSLAMDHPWKNRLVDEAKALGIRLNMKAFDSVRESNPADVLNCFKKATRRCTTRDDINVFIIEEATRPKKRARR